MTSVETDPNNEIVVSNLVNFSNLERVFEQIFDKLDKIDNRLQVCENEINKKVSLSRFLSLQHEYESNVSLFETRIQTLEETVTQLKPLTEKVNNNAVHISQIKENQTSLIEASTVEEQLNNLNSNLTNAIDKVSNNKCNNVRAKKLEESQYDICQQLSAMESMLQCKVDRSQIPLVESCSKQLNSLERFRDQISQRVCIMDDQLSDIMNDISNKVDIDIFNDYKLNEMETKLSHKVDIKFLNNEVIKRLNKLANDVLLLLQEHKQVSIIELKNEINKISNQCSQCSNKTETIDTQLNDISKQVRYNTPSLQQFDKKADRTYTEQLNDECKEFVRSNNTAMEKKLLLTNKQIENLKKLSNKIEQQMTVVLRFIDWYSTVQLNK